MILDTPCTAGARIATTTSVLYSFRHGGDLKWNSTEKSCELLWRDATSQTYQALIFNQILLIPPMLLFWKKLSKIFKKLPKIGASKHPWLTANAQLGTSFFGNLKNPAIFKFQNIGRPEHVSTPLVTKHKNHVFSGRTEKEKEKDKQFGPCART